MPFVTTPTHIDSGRCCVSDTPTARPAADPISPTRRQAVRESAILGWQLYASTKKRPETLDSGISIPDISQESEPLTIHHGRRRQRRRGGADRGTERAHRLRDTRFDEASRVPHRVRLLILQPTLPIIEIQLDAHIFFSSHVHTHTHTLAHRHTDTHLVVSFHLGSMPRF